ALARGLHPRGPGRLGGRLRPPGGVQALRPGGRVGPVQRRPTPRLSALRPGRRRRAAPAGLAAPPRPARGAPAVNGSPPGQSWLPTDHWTRALLVPALVGIASGISRSYQTDLWHHLARGKVLIEEGLLLNTDRFTYTVHGQPLQDVNWGWQAVFYLLFRAG